MRSFLVTLLLLGAHATASFKCPDSNGWYPDRTNCSRFIECSNWMPYTFDCPNGLHFMAERLICEWPHIAKCNSSSMIIGSTSTPQEPDIIAEKTAADLSGAPDGTSALTDITTSTEETESRPLADPVSDVQCTPLRVDQVSRGSLKWRRWQYGETMPQDVLKVGNVVLSDPSSGRSTRQFSTIVQVVYNGTKHFGTTMGPSKFANSGIYFVHNGKLMERNYEFVQILCVNSEAGNNMFWVQADRESCAPEGASIVDDEFLIGRTVHDPESGLFVASGLKQGEPLTTAFKTVMTHNVYQVLVERKSKI